jgi:hypothetical protein
MSKTYRCPYNADLVIRGMCEEVRCPAHMGTDAKHPSACIHNLLSFKRDITVHEIAFAFDTTVQKVKTHFERQKVKIGNVVQLYQYCEEIRYDSFGGCKNCGRHSCSNESECKRINLKVSAALKRFPFNLPSLQMDTELFFKLVHYRN